MRISSSFLVLATTVTALSIPRQEPTNSTTGPVLPALFDGKCYYPTADSHFELSSYLGKWYQVAGTPFGETAGARCVAAEYQPNDDGTVKVLNTARFGPQPISIVGTAAPADPKYGANGVFRVSFPGIPAPECKGPNYIVQEYKTEYAIVQTQNWNTLYILSRERNPEKTKIDTWIERAVNLGSNATAISYFDQTDC